MFALTKKSLSGIFALISTPIYRQLFDFLCLASIAISVPEASGGDPGV
jgi:hypothetical protein